MSTQRLIVRCRLRQFILQRCAHWHINRKRVPAAFIDGIADDLLKQVDVRICAELTKPDPLPKPPALPRPRKARVYKRAMRNQPSLF